MAGTMAGPRRLQRPSGEWYLRAKPRQASPSPEYQCSSTVFVKTPQYTRARTHTHSHVLSHTHTLKRTFLRVTTAVSALST